MVIGLCLNGYDDSVIIMAFLVNIDENDSDQRRDKNAIENDHISLLCECRDDSPLSLIVSLFVKPLARCKVKTDKNIGSIFVTEIKEAQSI